MICLSRRVDALADERRHSRKPNSRLEAVNQTGKKTHAQRRIRSKPKRFCAKSSSATRKIQTPV
ncbi:MAG: hypothetical protein WKF71_11300 [Pyrinomonadaceae bacterium]